MLAVTNSLVLLWQLLLQPKLLLWSTSLLFTLNKEKQRLFWSQSSACGWGYLQYSRGMLPFALRPQQDFFGTVWWQTPSLLWSLCTQPRASERAGDVLCTHEPNWLDLGGKRGWACTKWTRKKRPPEIWLCFSVWIAFSHYLRLFFCNFWTL